MTDRYTAEEQGAMVVVFLLVFGLLLLCLFVPGLGLEILKLFLDILLD